MPNSNKTNQPQNTQIPKPPLSPTPIVPLQMEPEPIFVMTIELDQGKVGHIKIYPDSIAEILEEMVVSSSVLRVLSAASE